MITLAQINAGISVEVTNPATGAKRPGQVTGVSPGDVNLQSRLAEFEVTYTDGELPASGWFSNADDNVSPAPATAGTKPAS